MIRSFAIMAALVLVSSLTAAEDLKKLGLDDASAVTPRIETHLPTDRTDAER